jgi:putative ABC transport system ATP-binding protein
MDETRHREPLVKIEGVTRDYRQGDLVVRALRGIDLEIHAGELTAIAGPSGSGKTTLLNIVSGLDQPTSGLVVVDGRRVTGMSRAQMSRLRLERIGFVFQAYNLLPVLTAYENAEYVLMMQGVPLRERRTRVMRLLARVGLEGMEHRYPRELSGGQQQRVAIARAMASEPALVLADEPTANLDSATAEDLLDLMAQLNEEKGITFVFSTHDRAVMRRSRRLISLKDGTVQHDGAPSLVNGGSAA